MKTKSLHHLRHAPWAMAVMGLLAGCGKTPEATAPTVSYYQAHADERQRQLAKCADDPGELGKTPACVNADAAEEKDSVGSFRKLPPMGLPGNSKAPADKH